MIKILTAIGDPFLNTQIKKENDFEVIGKDILYKEAILEMLNKNSNIDVIIISELLEGQIDTYEMLKEINRINSKIKIIYILEKNNFNFENLSKKEKNIIIIYNQNINIQEFIFKVKKIIKDEKLEYQNKKILKNNNEFKKENLSVKNFFTLRKILNKNKLLKNELIKNLKIKFINKCRNKLIKNNKKNLYNNYKNNIYCFTGSSGVGKTINLIIFSNFFKEKKILLIDLNLKKQDIHTILGIKKYPTIINKYHKIKYYKISNKKYNIKIKNFNIISFKKIINKIKKENKYGKIFLEEKDLDKIIKIFLFKINKNISFFSGINYLLKLEIKSEENIKIILEKIIINLKNNYDYIFIDFSTENLFYINKIILNYCSKIIFFIEANLLGIKSSIKILEYLIKKYNFNINKINIIINKYSKTAIDDNLLKKFFLDIRILGKIKYSEKYNYLINNYNKNKFFLNTFFIKNNYNKIIKKLGRE